jgi:hypothetical protein
VLYPGLGEDEDLIQIDHKKYFMNGCKISSIIFMNVTEESVNQKA